MTSNVEITEKFLEECVAKWLTENDYKQVTRQFNLGYYGIADIVTLTNDYDALYIDIFELKKGCIDCKAIAQVLKYRAGMKLLLKAVTDMPFVIHCNLVGRDAINDAEKAFPGIDRFDMWVYKYGYSGFDMSTEEIERPNYFEGIKNHPYFVCADYKSHDLFAQVYNGKFPSAPDIVPTSIKYGLI